MFRKYYEKDWKPSDVKAISVPEWFSIMRQNGVGSETKTDVDQLPTKKKGK